MMRDVAGFDRPALAKGAADPRFLAILDKVGLPH